MRKLLPPLIFLLLAGPAFGQVYDTSGREKVNVETGTVTVSDGAGALNTIVDSGTLTCNAGTGTFTVGDGAGALNVIVDSGAVTVSDGAGALNTIVDSGSLTCNAGTNLNTSALALDATLTGRLPAGASPADNESNTNTNLSRIGTFVFKYDGATWDRWDGNVGINGSVAVTGTFWQATQPVSGTVAATQSGAWSNRITDGTDTAEVFNLAANDPLSVAIVDGSGTQITSFGGGVQYTEADTDASITGTAMLWEDTADTLRAVSSAKPLPVNVVAGGAGDGSILDGVSSAIKATVLDYTNSNPLAVRLTDTSGDYVGAGAGTQYADGAAQATPTGTVALGHDGSNVRAVTTDASGDLQVDVLTMPTTTVTATDLDIRNLTATDTVTVTDGAGALNVIVDSGALNNIGPTASATPSQAGLAGGTDGTNLRGIKTDTNGELQVDVLSMPTTTVTDGAGAMNVIVDSGSVNVSDGAGALNVIVDSGTLTSITNTVTVSDGAGAMNVIVDSGTITASDPTFTDATGTTVPANAAFVGGTDGTNTRALKTDASGELQVDVLTMPTTTVTATNLDVQIGGSDSLTIGTFPDNEPVNVAQKGGAAVVAGACEREAPLYVQISQTTGTQLITGTASERIYICSIQIMTATAQNVALVDGTGSVCATSPTGLLGGSTAATGWNFAANGGIVLPESRGGWTKTSTDADNVCLLQSSTGQISGSITYVSVPNI